MEEELEKYIRDHRKEFDDAKPSGKVWENIAKQLPEDKKKPISLNWFWKVAAVFFFATSGILFYQLLQQEKETELAVIESNEDVIAEFTHAESYYLKEINAKLASMKENTELDGELVENFTEDIENLNSQYEQLKNELSDNQNEQILNALIQNLQTQLELLNKQLEIINDAKITKEDEEISI